MSIVIPFRTNKPGPPNGGFNRDAQQLFAVTRAKVELVCWRILVIELRKLEGRAVECKDALECLPNSPDKSSAMNALTVALQAIQAELAVCFSAANQLEDHPG